MAMSMRHSQRYWQTLESSHNGWCTVILTAREQAEMSNGSAYRMAHDCDKPERARRVDSRRVPLMAPPSTPFACKRKSEEHREL